MEFVIILAVLSIAFANPTLLGTEKCTYGPAYWCKSLKTSQECTAIKHCLLNDWKRMQVNVQTSSQCELCQHSVVQGRELQQKGASKDQIEAFIESFCSKVDEEIHDECMAEIIQILESELSPGVTCHLVELCDASDEEGKPVSDELIHVPLKLDEQYKPMLSLVPAKMREPEAVEPVTEVSVGNKTWCTDCKRFFQDIKNTMLSNKTEEEFEQLLDNFVCAGLGPLEKTCKKLVHLVSPLIQNYLASEFDPNQECMAIGFCPGNRMPARFMRTMVSKNVSVCDDCKHFFQDIRDMIASEELEKKVEKIVDQIVCGSLGPLAETCKGLVKTLLPKALDMLQQYVVPVQDCQALGFCTASNPLKLRFELLNLRHLMIKPNAATCDVCHVMVKELKSLIEDPTTQKKIMSFVENEICGLFKSEKEALCPSLVRVGIDRAVNSLTINFQKTIQCIKLVKEYGPEVITVIVTELDPTTLCKALGLCPVDVAINDTPEPEPIPDKVSAPANENYDHKLSASTQCILCEFVIRELQTLLKKNSTEEQILAALDKVCDLLPGSIKEQCGAFIDQYGPAILALLEQELDPKSICTMIGLCQAEERIHKHPVAGHVSAFASEECRICQDIIQYTFALLKENSTAQEIQAVLEKVCNFLPSGMRAKCDALVEEYTQTIITLITEMLTPLEICQTIGMCVKAKVDTALYFQPRLRIIQNNDNNNININ